MTRKNPVLVKLIGGLGNQMFQFAVGKIIAKSNHSEMLVNDQFFTQVTENTMKFPRQLDIGIFKNAFQLATEKEIGYFIRLSYYNRLKKKLGINYPNIYKESSYNYDSKVLKLKAPVYLKGYFQSYKYFLGKENLIQDLFKFPDERLDSYNKRLKQRIITKTCVAVHIRRGDYIQNRKTQQFHGNCTVEYYQRAIEYISSVMTDYCLVFFSDDISWAEVEFRDFPNEKIFVQGNLGQDGWIDMYLMSLCNHNIIANSSFSWWAAYLNKNSDKIVIAPKIWFANIDQESRTGDLIPPDWHRI